MGLIPKHDYLYEIKQDVRAYIEDNIDLSAWEHDPDWLADHLRDELWTVDSVTGNASGSYTFNAWVAEENLCHNWELLEEAVREFGEDGADVLKKGAEWCDVTIRCFLLGQAIDEVVNEFAW